MRDEIDSLLEKFDNMGRLAFKRDEMESMFPDGYHFGDITWKGDTYDVHFEVSDGYALTLGYSPDELPATINSKKLVSDEDTVKQTAKLFDETIKTGASTRTIISQKNKRGVEHKYLIFNSIISTDKNGRAKTIFGFQIEID